MISMGRKLENRNNSIKHVYDPIHVFANFIGPLSVPSTDMPDVWTY